MRTRDESKEEAIRQKALEMAVNEGFDGFSMQKLAKGAGVSPATLYIYFKDRDDLLIELYIEQQDKMQEATLKGFDPEMHFDEGLKLQWMNRARFCIENPLSMHFLEQMKFSPYFEPCSKRLKPGLRDIMMAFTRKAIQNKELVELPLEVYWSIAFSPLYNLVKFHMTKRGLGGFRAFVLTDEIMDQTLQLVLKALKP
jgi:TetR/AcrR family transcriptional regulator, multidrug resistance operon repressor